MFTQWQGRKTRESNLHPLSIANPESIQKSRVSDRICIPSKSLKQDLLASQLALNIASRRFVLT